MMVKAKAEVIPNSNHTTLAKGIISVYRRGLILTVFAWSPLVDKSLSYNDSVQNDLYYLLAKYYF